jgi:uncharacterized membrane protein YozB (DUF420 family)
LYNAVPDVFFGSHERETPTSGTVSSTDVKELPMEANIYDNARSAELPQRAKAPAKKAWTAWRVPAALILLSIIPLTFGVLRLIQLAEGAEVTPENARFFAAPLPVILHIVGAAIYALLGAFQFVSRLWRRDTSWHRWVGRLLVPCGLVVGLSGLWMTLFYPHPEGASNLLYALRLLFGSGMVFSIVLGYAAIRQRDILQHRAWTMRGYAIGLGAGTQVLTGMIGAVVFGKPDELENALLMGAGWVINLVVAEWVIRKRLIHQTRTA